MKAKFLWLLLVNVTLATAQVQVIPAQLYQKIVERGYETQEVVTRLANYYYTNHNETQALKYYQKLIKGIGYQLDPIEHYRYAVLLQKVGKKSEAKRQMSVFDDKMQLLFTKHPNTTSNDLMGLVTDAEKGTVVAGAQVFLINAAGETLTDTSDINGFFVFSVNKIYPNFQDAYIEIQKNNYELMSQPISLTTAQQKIYSLFPNVFEVNKGEKVAILGKTGSGKSTIFQLLNRHYDPTSGQILLANCNVADYPEATLRSHLVTLSQRVHIFSQTLRDNLLMGNPHATDEQLKLVLEQVELAYLLQEQDLNLWLGEGGRPLSGGEQRRLGLARVLLSNAELVLLDEPTEGLDRETEQQILTLIFTHCQTRTLLMITHRLQGLKSFDRIYRIDNGQLLA